MPPWACSQLPRYRVVAPVNGYVTDLTLSPGSYATVGGPMLAIVNTDKGLDNP